MDDNEVIDIFINNLYKKGRKAASITDVVSVDKLQRERVEITLAEKGLVKEVESYAAGKRCFRISTLGIDIVSNYNSYGEYMEAMNMQQSRTTNIHAQNVTYLEGDNHGSQSFSSDSGNSIASHTISKYSEGKTSKTSGIQIVYWILGILVALTVLYTFLEPHLPFE